MRSAWLKAGAQVKVDVAPPKDLAAVAKAAHAIHVANEQKRAREIAAGKELAAEGPNPNPNPDPNPNRDPSQPAS